MKAFEEEFPSLKKYYDEWSCAEDSGFYTDEIRECCLDKERVKEAIDKLSTQAILGDTLVIAINPGELRKELGL